MLNLSSQNIAKSWKSNTSVLPAKGMKDTSGPQDLHMQKHYIKNIAIWVGVTTLLLMLRRGTLQNDYVRKSGLQVQMGKQRNKWFCPVGAEEHSI